MVSDYIIDIDLKLTPSLPKIIKLNQYDRGIYLKVNLFDNGEPYTILNTETPIVELALPKNKGYIISGSSIKDISGNSFRVAIDRNISLNSGEASFNVALVDKATGTTTRKGSFKNYIRISSNSIDEGTVSEDLAVSVIETLQSNVATATAKETSLREAIKNADLSNYATTSDLTKKINDIQIGTRNYLLNTGLKDDASSFSGLNNEVVRVTTKKTPSGNNCFYTKLSNKTNKVWIGPMQEVTSGFSEGDTMTFSVQTYVTNEIAIDEGLFIEVVGVASDNSTRTFVINKQINASNVNKWVKYELTFVVPENTVKIKCLSYVVKNGSWYTGDYKLEKGNKVTDWSLNPTDIYNAILESKKSLYPVGSLYFNATKEANPSQLLGFGTWERIAQGKTLIGVDTKDTDFNTAGKTGGSKTHNHTSGTLVANIGAVGNDTGSIGYATADPALSQYTLGISGSAITDMQDRNINHATSTSGSTDSSGNMPPYITVYIWKRTA